MIKFGKSAVIRQAWQSTLIRSSGIYTIASFLNAAIPFLLLPVLTKYLSAQDFGIVAMFITYTGFLMPVVGINMEAAVARKYYADKESIPVYIGNCILLSLVSFCLVLLAMLVLDERLVKYTGIPTRWLMLGVVVTFFQFLITISLTLFQVKVKPLKYGLVQITQSALNFGLSILLIISLRMSWEGRLFAQLIATGTFGCIAIIILLRNGDLTFKWNKSFAIHAIKFGSALIPHTLGGLFILYTMRFFLLHHSGMGELGRFSVATQVASILGFFTFSFNNAYVPWLYNKLNENNAATRKLIVRFTYLYFAAIAAAGFLFYLGTPLLFRMFINRKFWDAAAFTPWIIAGFVFQGMYFMVANYISYVEKTWYQAIVTIIAGLCNIPICYLLTNRFGANGAGLSFAISYCMLFVFTWVLSARLYKMPWR